jgi:hypothetical protein
VGREVCEEIVLDLTRPCDLSPGDKEGLATLELPQVAPAPVADRLARAELDECADP